MKRYNFSMKKLAIGVSSALCVVGAQQVSADALLFPYVANSPTLTTIVTVANTGSASSLHYQYFYKPSASVDSLTASCEEYDFYNNTSVNDLVTFDVDGAAAPTNNGVLFEDATGAFKNVNYLNNFGVFPDPSRGYVMVNNDGDADGSLTGTAIVFDIANGAAWGYTAYNSAASATTDFSNLQEVEGEVLQGATGAGVAPFESGFVDIYPGSDWVTKLFVTPIDDSTYTQGLINESVNVSVEANWTDSTATAMYDRDENPYSGAVTKTVTCVGSVDVKTLFSSVTQNIYNTSGGYTLAYLPLGSGATTSEAVVQKLVYNTGSTLGVLPITGAINSAEWLRSLRWWSATQTVFGNAGKGNDAFGY